MRKSIKKVIVMIIAFVMVASCTVPAFAAGVRGRNTSAVKSGCKVVNVNGNFETPNITALLKRINAIRYEACAAGNVPDPRNPKRNLTKADYVPIKWSKELEKMSQLRAAEATIVFAHSRPNGDSDPWGAAYGVQANGENLSGGKMAESIERYYSEKAEWIRARQFKMNTGHYCNMINPSMRHIALGSFTNSFGSTCSSMHVVSWSGLNENKTGEYGAYTQQIEMTSALASKYTPAKPATVNPTGITLNRTSASMTAGGTLSLTATVKPSNATNKKVTWASSNTSIATVSNGKVTAKKAGTVTITAKASNGKAAKCKVTVRAKAKAKAKAVVATGITLNKTSASMTVGGTLSLTATVKPSNTTNKKVTWASSNTSIATVSNGKVTAKKAGTVTITAKTSNGKAAKCKVTVKNRQTTAASGSYKNVSEAYTLLNSFRTTKSNQWYWSQNNKTKVTTYGLKTLKKDTVLENIAKVRAKEAWTMYYERGTVTHNRPNGKSCWTAYNGTNPVGECLAIGHTSCKMVITDPNYGWAGTNMSYASQGNRRMMLSSQATKVGIACYTKDGKTCWIMCLGR